MPIEDAEFLKRLLATFKIEAEEHLQTMSALMLSLERPETPAQQPALIESLFREAHSLKGAARSVNLADIETVCQAMESVLAALKRQQLDLTPAVFEALYRPLDRLGAWLEARVGGALPTDPEQVAELIAPLQRVLGATDAEPAGTAAPEPPSLPAPAGRLDTKGETAPAEPATETVRISTAKLTSLLIQAEELLSFKYSAGHLVGELKALRATLTDWKKDWVKTVRDARSIRRGAERHLNTPAPNGAHAAGNPANGTPRNGKRHAPTDRVLDAVERDEFLVKSLVDRLAQIEHLAELERRALAAMVDNLLEDMKRALMLPFGTLLELLPKLVRDLARDSGKDVALVVNGATIEIDRRILEQLKDPLIHLVRNAIDHGIESPAERQRRGKPRQGHITIDIAAREGNIIELSIADDGAGIDRAKVKATALKLNLVSPDTADGLEPQDVLGLVFESGLSTSPIITDLSGRGLGLAIVREKVEQLGGRIVLESTPQRETRFTVTLPSTLSTFRGLLVRVNGAPFVLPSLNVERVVRVPRDTIRTVENRETIELGGEAMSLVWLADALSLPRAAAADTYCPAVVLNHAARRVAFAVDEVVADQEVLVKPLGPQLQRVRNVAAATVLGAGRVVPILNVADLLKTAARVTPAQPGEVATEAQAGAAPRSLLVVEDSITSRSLLKGILEGAGYQVATAVDGLDALATLRTGDFDLVVSDVEMPRMDGFDLTARVRQDAKLAQLPVVLVTALDSREDRERGIDVGADAYIVKSSFDQGNLLEVIQRLL